MRSPKTVSPDEAIVRYREVAIREPGDPFDYLDDATVDALANWVGANAHRLGPEDPTPTDVMDQLWSRGL